MTEDTKAIVIQITGSRTFKQPAPIKYILQKFVDRYGADNIILRHGNARGADKLSEFVAQKLGIKNIQSRPVEYYGISWDKDGKNAGNLRNLAMLEEEPIPNIVLAFPDKNSKGTWNMINFALDKGIKTKIWKGELE